MASSKASPALLHTISLTMEEELFCLLLVMIGYAMGAIPFGIVVSKALNLPDPRGVGSKNVGFTNVLRVSGAKAGVLTLLGDMGKGWLIGWAAMHWLQTESFIMLAALSPIIGHIFSPFLAFKGGKGVATALGSVLGLSPSIGTLLLLIWLNTFIAPALMMFYFKKMCMITSLHVVDAAERRIPYLACVII